jgi:hypothetical protein
LVGALHDHKQFESDLQRAELPNHLMRRSRSLIDV